MKRLTLILMIITLSVLCGSLSWAVSPKPPSVLLENGGKNFGPGDMLSLAIGVSAENSSPVTVDAYLALLVPKEQSWVPVFFEPGPNGLIPLVARLEDNSTWKKLVSDITLQGTFHAGPLHVFTYQFTGDEQPVTYYSAFLLTHAGTFDPVDYRVEPFLVVPYPISGLLGTYTGTWTNHRFGSSGPISFSVSETVPGALSIAVTPGGSVFGAEAPPLFTVAASLTRGDIILSGGSASFGTVDGTITIGTDGMGKVQGTVRAIPGEAIESVSFSGTLSSGVLTLQYTVNFKDGSTATGDVTAQK